MRGKKDKPEQQKASYQKRGELVVIPPIDSAQLKKLLTSLQQLPGLRILSTGGSSDGSAHITVSMEKPAPLADALRGLDIVEEAIEEQAIDSQPLGDFLKKTLPKRSSRRRAEQRIFLVLERTQT